jgi:hypothetical protein
VSPESAAAFLGMTAAELVALAREGEIPRAVCDARGWHFAQEGLERYMKCRARQDAA